MRVPATVDVIAVRASTRQRGQRGRKTYTQITATTTRPAAATNDRTYNDSGPINAAKYALLKNHVSAVTSVARWLRAARIGCRRAVRMRTSSGSRIRGVRGAGRAADVLLLALLLRARFDAM